MYLSRMANNTGTCSVSITLAAPFPSTDRIRVPCCFSVQFPTANPVEVPPAPLAVRCGGAPERQVQHSCVAQGQPLCWARCPCVVIPLWVIPHVYSSTVRLPSRWARVFPCAEDLLPSLLCSYLTPSWLSLPQRLPYVVLPLASPYV